MPVVEDNRILAALPEAERERLAARLEPIRHRVRDTVYEQGERVRSVVFPLSGVYSLVVVADNGRGPVEIATVGREGFVGLPVFLQATLTGAHMAFSQVEGDGAADGRRRLPRRRQRRAGAAHRRCSATRWR